MLDHLDALLPRYRLALKKHSQFEKMTDFQQQVTTLARKTIQEYRDYIMEYTEPKAKTIVGFGAGGKTGHGNTFGKDGTIYTLTVETLNFIRRLYEYRRVIEHTPTLLDKHHAGQAAQAEKEARQREQQELDTRLGMGSNANGTSGLSALSNHALEDHSPLTRLVQFLLSGLEANMDTRSKAFKLPSLSAIFLLNNFHYAARFLRKYDSIFLTSSQGNLQSTVDRYDKLVHTTMKQYRTVSWEKIVTQALETSDIIDLYRAYASAAPGSSNHKSARKAIKAKFAFFNSTFDELYHTQRYFAIPDSDLRSQLRNDNVELIMQGYKLLYETSAHTEAHHSTIDDHSTRNIISLLFLFSFLRASIFFSSSFSPVNFSTNPAKYMKYRPDTVESMINKFFDETAT